MIRPLHVASRGYLNSPLGVASFGYLTRTLSRAGGSGGGVAAARRILTPRAKLNDHRVIALAMMLAAYMDSEP